MSHWEKFWRCKKCENLNPDHSWRCAHCDKTRLEAWEKTVYKCKNCNNFFDSPPNPCPICGKK